MVDKIWYNMEELIGGSEERGINRNILECKVLCYAGRYDRTYVLIETYWNVKTESSACSMTRLTSINRNILECKGCMESCVDLSDCVLIETYWNVKIIVFCQLCFEP